MALRGKELKKLQEHWYKVLEKSGFKDIEVLVDGELYLRQMAHHSFWDTTHFEFKMGREYFRIVYEKAHDEGTFYKNEVDKMILQMHSNGAKIVEIMKSLDLLGDTRNRASVRFIIRRYLTEWKIRQFSPKQLNKKSSC